MGRTFDKSVLVGVGLLVALLVGNAGLAYRNTRQLLEDAGWVAHTQEVLDLTSDVLRTLVDAETGQRGFLITGKDTFLEPHQQALARPDQQVRTLKDKTKDNPRQQSRIEEFGDVDRRAAGPVEKRASTCAARAPRKPRRLPPRARARRRWTPSGGSSPQWKKRNTAYSGTGSGSPPPPTAPPWRPN